MKRVGIFLRCESFNPTLTKSSLCFMILGSFSRQRPTGSPRPWEVACHQDGARLLAGGYRMFPSCFPETTESWLEAPSSLTFHPTWRPPLCPLLSPRGTGPKMATPSGEVSLCLSCIFTSQPEPGEGTGDLMPGRETGQGVKTGWRPRGQGSA